MEKKQHLVFISREDYEPIAIQKIDKFKQCFSYKQTPKGEYLASIIEAKKSLDDLEKMIQFEIDGCEND